jgi:hypothetical protein
MKDKWAHILNVAALLFACGALAYSIHARRIVEAAFRDIRAMECISFCISHSGKLVSEPQCICRDGTVSKEES